ncbi:hypothetical protein [Rhodopirellula halodulae]|uniref:hypothetical protein n=1 Tax=Rhodopirellula halodulae TaxID=2894198 RepID=UPI001E3E0F93|nr:hypothetical protein [Rhodopirellula sp. JC737]
MCIVGVWVKVGKIERKTAVLDARAGYKKRLTGGIESIDVDTKVDQFCIDRYTLPLDAQL